jgi:hypothetical protein
MYRTALDALSVNLRSKSEMTEKPVVKLFVVLGFVECFTALFVICAPRSPSSDLLVGTFFGGTLSACLWLRKYLNAFWKMLAITAATSIAIPVSALLAAYLELISPYPFHEIGTRLSVMSSASLFIGGMLGALLILSTVLSLVDSGTPWTRILAKSLGWSPVGGALGIVGYNLGPWLGLVLWTLKHSLVHAIPGDKFEYALARGEPAMISLLLLWFSGMGVLLGLALDSQQTETLDDSQHHESSAKS